MKPEDLSKLTQGALERLRHKLLDLSRRNRLLNFRETARTIRVVDELPNEVFRALVIENKTLTFVPLPEEDVDEDELLLIIDDGNDKKTLSEPDIDKNRELPKPKKEVDKKHQDKYLQTPFTAIPLERRSKNLLRESNNAINETGSNLFFLAIGFLEWYEDDNSSIKSLAPLILVPVQLERSRLDRSTNCYTYNVTYTGEDIETNLSLAEKLDRDFDLVLPQLSDEINTEKYFDEVSKVVGVKRRWRVAREMVFGLFSFAKLLMYKDLDKTRWPATNNISEHSNVQKVLIGSEETSESEYIIYGEEYELDDNTQAESIPLILDADSSQHSAIIDALSGKNIVIEGPPGTGKSQTITNLIASALCEGKSVLFVAEKKAALEVVKRRLDHVGLGDFCLELHSHKTHKGQLHSGLKKRLDRSYRDSSRLIDYEMEDLQREKEKLNSYVNLINNKAGPSEETIYDILWSAERWRTEVTDRYRYFLVSNSLKLTRREINERIDKLEDIVQIRNDLTNSAFEAWNGFPVYNIVADEERIKELLTSFCKRTRIVVDELDKVKSETTIPLKDSVFAIKEIAGIDTKILLSVPENIDGKLAVQFLDPEVMDTLNELSAAILEYSKLINLAEDTFLKCQNLSVDKIKAIFLVADELLAKGFADTHHNDIGILINTANDCTKLLELLPLAAVHLSKVVKDNSNTLKDFSSFIDFSNHLKAAPYNIDISSHSEHVLSLAPALLKNIKHECLKLEEDCQKLSKVFVLDCVPPEKEIRSLSTELRSFQGKAFAFLSGSLRQTKRSIRGFLLNPKSFKFLNTENISQLDKLAETIKAIDVIKSNPENNRVFGPLFVGLETDWENLEKQILWAQPVRTITGSTITAKEVINNISAYRDEVIPAGEKVEKILSSVHSLCESLNLSINSELTVNSELTLDELIERTQSVKEQLECLMSALSNVELKSSADIDQIRNSSEAFIDSEHIRTTIKMDKRFAERLQGHFQGLDSNIDLIKAMAEWVTTLKTNQNVPSEILEWLLEQNTEERSKTLSNIITLLKEYTNELSDFESAQDKISLDNFDFEVFMRANEHDCSLQEINNKVNDCLREFDSVLSWSDYCTAAYLDASRLGLNEIVCSMEADTIKLDYVVPIYKASLYGSMAKELIQQHPQLSSFSRVSYEHTRKKFAELDKKIIESMRDRVAYKISKRNVPRGTSFGRVNDYTDLALITHEVNKKKRHIPIRQLVRRSGNALKALKPCFMMSPMSVAQYLEPGDIPFDMIVMDEASQIKPEDALGSIARGYQMIIVGDPKQLPPTTFFERINDNLDEEEMMAIEDTESILDASLSTISVRPLRWHYRSDHESLIAFSNKEFYDENLIIFPSPHTNDKLLGVYSNYIEGATYQRGRNQVEAEAVALAVIEHFNQYPKLSLGVATFNLEQKNLIEDWIDRFQKQNPKFEKAVKLTEGTPEPFFVKNLENVQGDERDIIFISTTYGPDHDTGKVYQRFGPIGGQLGWRRLNVIFTRAKKKIVLFTSMKPTDVLISENSSRGVRALRTYLDYAEHGRFPEHGKLSDKEPDSDFEIAVSRILEQSGYKTVPQVGVAGFFIDLGVLHPSRESEFILGVECDGATYHSAKSARDRDRLRQEILESKGWKIHRIWSTDWFRSREQEIKRLLRAIESLLDEERSQITIDLSREQKETHENVIQTTSLRTSSDQTHSDQSAQLRADLLQYRRINIEKRYPDTSTGILRDEMIEIFISSKPIVLEEFHKEFPVRLRQNTEGSQMQFLEDIFEIIEECL